MQNTQILHYTVSSVLGQGGMATVYLAHDNKFDSKVAIKILNKEFIHNENIRKRFLAEAKSMFRMSHPNIIKVTDLIEENDTVAFVMEYVEGETLKEYIDRKGKLTDAEIKTIFSQMLEAVGYVHKQNLVHRDIKPSNFMIDLEGNIKLMDFGIAKNTDATSAEYTQTGTGMQMGTPMYMSPEQIIQTKNVTTQSDIYSLGVVLWQMVTGEKPYDTKTLSSFQLQTKIVNDPLPNSNTTWDSIIDKATQKEVGNRFSDCVTFKNTLNESSQKKALSKNNIDKEEHTVVEQSIPKEKEIPMDNKIQDKIESSSSPKIETTTKKRKWVIPAIVLVLAALILFFFIGNDTVTDIDGNTYKVVKIGDQEWMQQNLNVSKFRNGDLIPEAKTNEEWAQAGENKQPAWCYHENKSSNGKKYGKLYNWYAVNDPRGLAPDGWHVPSDKEWDKLIKLAGPENGASKKLISKQAGKEVKGTDDFGFEGLEGGLRFNGGINGMSFSVLDYGGFWWSITEYDYLNANSFALGFDFDLNLEKIDKNYGISVRCIKD
jgi:uncharacterized protein (TIGR02145 family)